MTLKLLKEKGCKVSIIFSGDENKTTESIIKKMTGVPVIGRIEEEAFFDKDVILKYATLFAKQL